MNRTVAVLAAAAAAVCALAGCGSGGSGDTGGSAGGSGDSRGSGGSGGSGGEGIVRFALPEVNSFDPRLSTPAANVAMEPVYDSLVARSPEGKIGPGLATTWEFAKDNTSLTLTIREGVTFQDGAPLNAQAVKANLLAFRKGTTRGHQLAAISSIDVIDELHVRLNLSAPATNLVSVLAGENGMMVSPKALNRKDLATHPVGAGPYKLVKATASKYEYRPWDGYWAADTVQNKGLDFSITSDTTAQLRGIKGGQLDLMKLAANQVNEAKSSGLKLTTAQTGDVWVVGLNTARAPFDKPDVRRAVSLALDRAAIAKAVFSDGCAPSVQPFGEGLPGHSGTLAKLPKDGFDLDKAKQLIEKAGAKGKTATILVGTYPQTQQLATVIQNELNEAGLQAKVQAIDPVAAITRVRAGDYAATLYPIAAERPGPANYIASYFQKDGTGNPGDWTMPEINSLLDQAKRTTGEAGRSAIYAHIAEIAHNAGSPAVPICNPTYPFAATESVSGVHAPRLGDFDWTSVQVN